MVRPLAFGSNPETLSTNAFQQVGETPVIAERARHEFDGVVARLERAGLQVVVAEDEQEPLKPDAVFPNNWLFLAHDGSAWLFPMLSARRRAERRMAVLDRLNECGFKVSRVVDLSHWEQQGLFLEGTGSMVLDHVHRVAYAALSPRTRHRPLMEFAALAGYHPHAFTALGPDGEPVYHTNVMMSLGPGFAVACLAAVAEQGERLTLRQSLEAAGRELIEIDARQMAAFAGNLLAIWRDRGGPVIGLSTTALRSLTPAQVRALERHGEVAECAIPTIEAYGGGSLRCMLAEVFLPR
ncbi:MAG: citrulline utilization hydrolase CtlX [Steroidobacteraceae bacterium]